MSYGLPLPEGTYVLMASSRDDSIIMGRIVEGALVPVEGPIPPLRIEDPEALKRHKQYMARVEQIEGKDHLPP